MNTLRFLAISFLALANSALAAQQAETRGLRFELSFNSSVRSGPTTGRMFVMISGNNERDGGLLQFQTAGEITAQFNSGKTFGTRVVIPEICVPPIDMLFRHRRLFDGFEGAWID